MIPRSGFARLTAFSAALMLHGVLAAALVRQEPVDLEGGEGSAEVRLGNAFADMVAGSLAPTPVTADVLKPEAPSAAPAAAMQPRTFASGQAVATIPVSPVPALARRPVATEASGPVPTVLHSVEIESTAVTRSLRPVQRSAALEKAVRKPTKPEPSRKTASTAGNAKLDTRAGEATGAVAAKARQSGTDGAVQAAGNAAASNYPGQVMRKLSRVGKPKVNARGAAVIAFTISDNGQLAALSLARSSGSAALDKAALSLVRDAGPFPRPPQGARRSFSIAIEGR